MPTLVVLAPHPDDEVWAFGSLILAARRAAVDVDVLFATSGEAARLPLDLVGTPDPRAALARRRQQEARAAAAVLGVREVRFAELPDGGLIEFAHFPALAELLDAQPYDAVASFGNDGGYGHRDHVACSRIAASYCALAGQRTLLWPLFGREPLSAVRHQLTRWQKRAGVELIDADAPLPGYSDQGGVVELDAGAARQTLRRALECHASQLGPDGGDGFLGRGTLDALDAAQGGVHRFVASPLPMPLWVAELGR